MSCLERNLLYCPQNAMFVLPGRCWRFSISCVPGVCQSEMRYIAITSVSTLSKYWEHICDRILENQPLCHIWHLKYFQLKQDITQHKSTLQWAQIQSVPWITRNPLKYFKSYMLWQQVKALGCIYFTCDKVVDFPKSGHIYYIYLLQCTIVLHHSIDKNY